MAWHLRTTKGQVTLETESGDVLLAFKPKEDFWLVFLNENAIHVVSKERLIQYCRNLVTQITGGSEQTIIVHHIRDN